MTSIHCGRELIVFCISPWQMERCSATTASSHGHVTVERGFSVNRQIEVENWKEYSYVSNRIVCEYTSTALDVKIFFCTFPISFSSIRSHLAFLLLYVLCLSLKCPHLCELDGFQRIFVSIPISGRSCGRAYSHWQQHSVQTPPSLLVGKEWKWCIADKDDQQKEKEMRTTWGFWKIRRSGWRETWKHWSSLQTILLSSRGKVWPYAFCKIERNEEIIPG